MIFSRDCTAKSWVPGADGSEFPLQNLPYGVFSTADTPRRIGVAIGDRVLDVARIVEAGLLDSIPQAAGMLCGDALNAFMAAGRSVWQATRTRLVALLANDDVTDHAGRPVRADRALRDDAALRGEALIDRHAADMHLPCRIGNFVDFYSSKEHATNVGSMFRDPSNPLLPNWMHIPIGYNGRSSSIVVSGTDIVRPCGQTKSDDADAPTFGPTRLLDIELEVGFLTGPPNALGDPIPIDRAMDHIFGMVLVNDWSARDVQRWEYVPLGPFLGKSFATSISPWVVTMDALAPFRVDGPEQNPQPLAYLRSAGERAYDIDLEVHLKPAGDADSSRIARTNFKYMYWTAEQQLAHLTCNGTNVEPGDLCASGTVSGPTPDSYGSLLELCWKGTKPIRLPDGQERRFLQDGDTVTMTGCCDADAFRVGFGAVAGTILPARPAKKVSG